MGMPSIPELLIILVVVGLIFGTAKLRNIGGDLGGAVKGFKKALKDETSEAKDDAEEIIETKEVAEKKS